MADQSYWQHNLLCPSLPGNLILNILLAVSWFRGGLLHSAFKVNCETLSILTVIYLKAEGFSPKYSTITQATMRQLVCFALFCLVFVTVQGKISTPKVQVYSHSPGEYGNRNTLICHVSGFHPPDITIDLLKDGEVLSDAQQTDLAFEKGWQFHLTKSVSFTPKKGENYICKVRHMSKAYNYAWEPNM